MRRVLHLPGRDANVNAVTAAAIEGRVTITGDAEVSWPTLDPTLPTTEALAVLDERVRGLLWMTDQNRKADLVKVHAVEAQATDTAAALAKVQADLSAAKLDLAVHGLRTEAFGLALVGLGLLIQLVGGLVT